MIEGLEYWTVWYHLRKLKGDGAFRPIDEDRTGRWEPVPGGPWKRWIGKGLEGGSSEGYKPTPPEGYKLGLAETSFRRLWGAPDYVILQNALFRIPVLAHNGLEAIPIHHEWGRCPVREPAVDVEDVPNTLRLWGNRPARGQLRVGDVQIDWYLIKDPEERLVPIADRILDTIAREAVRLLSKAYGLALDPDPRPFPNPLAKAASDRFPLRTGKLHFSTRDLGLQSGTRLFPSLEFNRSDPGPGLETGSSALAKALAEVLDLPRDLAALREEIRRLREGEP